MNAVMQTNKKDAKHDFDFLHGRWKVRNRRLVERLQGSKEWHEFEAINDCRPLPGELGNEDEYRTDYWRDFVGLTLRFYNPETQQWAIYWIDNRTPGVLQPPVIGSFDGDVGVFEGPDELRGKPIRVRFIWSRIAPSKARREQAISPDGGVTWETNWTMEMTKLS
jgi:hypothetical protein